MINGFLIINKKKGITSAKVVGIVKHLFYSIDKTQKLGHCGTLDPDGEGVLPIALGRATRLFDFLLNKTKTYYTEFTFGISTDTLDTSGNVVDRSDVIPTLVDVQRISAQMVGKTLQIPPMYSAKNYGGQRAYDLARQGVTVELSPKEIEIFDIEVVSQVSRDTYAFNITCSSGTYIRSIARDMGEKLGTFGSMSYIQRTKSGAFSIEDSVTLDQLSEANDVTQYVLPMEYVLAQLDTVSVTRSEEVRLLRGFSVDVTASQTDVVKVVVDDQLIALGEVKDGCLTVKSWLNSRAQRYDAKYVLCLGYFDGIHLGHQAIFDRAKVLADKQGWAYASIFPKNTTSYTSKSTQNLFDYATRLEDIKKYGMYPYFLPDTPQFFALSKDEFCQYIKKEIAPSYIVVGENFRFGKDREGDVSYLKQWFEGDKIKVEVVSLVEDGNKTVSTTLIKELLSKGEVQNAQKLMKYPYALCGTTQKGRGDGTKIGVPTFNLPITSDMFLPKLGVYSAICEIDGVVYKAVVNIGSAPTFGVDKVVVEAHVLGAVNAAAGAYIKIIPVRFLRDIRRFSSKEELVEQITKDMESVYND